MPRRITFTTADKVGEVQLHTEHRLSLLSDDRKRQLIGSLNPMSEQARQQAMISFINKNIAGITDSSLLLTRVGAYVFLFSQIENRLRAMYRQRYALMMDMPVPKSTEDQNGQELDEKIETFDLKKALLLLRDYEDIDANTTTELLLCIEMRNKLIHQALYRTDAFASDVIPALIELYNHMVRVRARLTTRIKNERKLYEPTTVQDTVRQLLADIPMHVNIDRLNVFVRTGGSPTVHVPMMHKQPLYLVAKAHKHPSPVQVNVLDENGHHNIWSKLVGNKVPYIIFKKYSEGNISKIRRIGEGMIESAEFDNSGRCKLLNINMQS